MESFEIVQHDVHLTVIGVYEPGETQTFEYPGSADGFEIHSIEVNGINIFDLIDLVILEDIEIEILETHFR